MTIEEKGSGGRGEERGAGLDKKGGIGLSIAGVVGGEGFEGAGPGGGIGIGEPRDDVADLLTGFGGDPPGEPLLGDNGGEGGLAVVQGSPGESFCHDKVAQGDLSVAKCPKALFKEERGLRDQLKILLPALGPGQTLKERFLNLPDKGGGVGAAAGQPPDLDLPRTENSGVDGGDGHPRTALRGEEPEPAIDPLEVDGDSCALRDRFGEIPASLFRQSLPGQPQGVHDPVKQGVALPLGDLLGLEKDVPSEGGNAFVGGNLSEAGIKGK